MLRHLSILALLALSSGVHAANSETVNGTWPVIVDTPTPREGPLIIDGCEIKPGAVCPGVDLRHADLRGLKLNGIDLSEAEKVPGFVRALTANGVMKFIATWLSTFKVSSHLGILVLVLAVLFAVGFYTLTAVELVAGILALTPAGVDVLADAEVRVDRVRARMLSGLSGDEQDALAAGLAACATALSD